MIWRLVAILAAIFSLYAAGYTFKKSWNNETFCFELDFVLVVCFAIEALVLIAVAVVI